MAYSLFGTIWHQQPSWWVHRDDEDDNDYAYDPDNRDDADDDEGDDSDNVDGYITDDKDDVADAITMMMVIW